jgi:hypothetical protein
VNRATYHGDLSDLVVKGKGVNAVHTVLGARLSIDGATDRAREGGYCGNREYGCSHGETLTKGVRERTVRTTRYWGIERDLTNTSSKLSI